MGRPVLDSDFAATVDSTLGEVRTLARELGCDASSDLGYLVTAGRLLALFAENHDRLVVTEGAPDVWLDYRYRFLERYPALQVSASSATARISVPLLQQPDAAADRLALWVRATAPTTIRVGGVPVAVAPQSPDAPERVEFARGGATLDPLEVEVDAGAEVWLFLLEEDSAAETAPTFCVAPGSYQVDGLVARSPGGVFPSIAFPDALGFPWGESPAPAPPLGGLVAPSSLTSGTRAVAYLEAWEREITAVEDPGIREEALGATDTATRTQLVGQVKLATISGSLPVAVDDAVAALRAAFGEVEMSGGEATIDVPQATPTTDPCALPEVSGYSGSDNRLYRLEVHRGGGLSQVRLKWSRDNGSQLFEARLDTNGYLVFPADTLLTTGDIVEVRSHVVDLGDDVLASVSAGGFVPAQRAVGQLAQLAAVGTGSSSDEVVFRLVDPDDISTPVALDDRYGVLPDAVLKLRRWDGILDPQQVAGGGAASPGPFVLEDGIAVTLSSTGSYRPGQWWQYEARVLGQNANGPWRPQPHGPERRFAPLALVEYQGAAQPLRIVAWLDERFSHPCELDADGVEFEGGRVGTASDTVQEALEELFERLPLLGSWPRIAADGISWRNDRTLPFTQFQSGLKVTFSEEMHPASATLDTFVVSLEVPTEDDPPNSLRRVLVIDGTVNVAGPTWTFVPRNVDAASVGRWVRDLGGPVRCRVALASEFILDRSGVRPLDGDVAGVIAHDGYDDFVDVKLPSGDGLRGGDFESWFYLTGPAPLVSIEHVNPADGAKLAAGMGPRTVLLAFSDNVRFGSIDPTTFTVSMRHSSQEGGDGESIPGTIEPYPYETQPGVVSRVTFTPENPEAMRPMEAPAAGPWIFTVRARGTGDSPIVDLDERALDGAGTGEASDFVSNFTVDVQTD